jgi:lambda repressor-like predicted transcriptional regulator
MQPQKILDKVFFVVYKRNQKRNIKHSTRRIKKMNKTHTTLKPSGMSPKEINDAIINKGLNQAAIARAIKVTPGSVSRAINDHSVQTRVMEAIAEAIGKDKKQIWPQHFLYGLPKRGRKMVTWDRKAA